MRLRDTTHSCNGRRSSWLVLLADLSKWLGVELFVYCYRFFFRFDLHYASAVLGIEPLFVSLLNYSVNLEGFGSSKRIQQLHLFFLAALTPLEVCLHVVKTSW